MENGDKINSNNKTVFLIKLICLLALLGVACYLIFGSGFDWFSNYKDYENIAKGIVNSEGYGTVVDTKSFGTDNEVHVTVEVRFEEGPNVSYQKYLVKIDKNTKKVMNISKTY